MLEVFRSVIMLFHEFYLKFMMLFKMFELKIFEGSSPYCLCQVIYWWEGGRSCYRSIYLPYAILN